MKKKTGLVLLGLSFLAILINIYLLKNESQSNILNFFTALFVIVGLLLVIPFELLPLVIFDNQEYEANGSIESLVQRMRYRAILFNNISVAIFIFTILVIFISFYLLVFPPINELASNPDYLATSLTIRIGASILLIFLVQILFRVFKYLLRVAAFYNAKADAIEFHKLKPEFELEKLMELFTPDKYDISDLQESSPTASLVDIIKSKF